MGCASSSEETLPVKEDEKKTENIKKIKSLGKGNFGEVFLIKSKLDKKKSALKEIPIKNKNIDLIMNEGDNLKELDHPNLMFYKSVFIANDILNVITEYAENGDLNNELLKHKEQNKYFDENQLLNWLMQICLSLQYIHEKRMVHSDIKPSNIFITKKNNIKLGDFGIFKRILDFEEEKLYGAPELIKKNEYTTKADIWSLGVTFSHLLTLEYPFEGKNKDEIYKNITKGEKKNYSEEILKKYSKEFLDLIDEMMSLDPKKRPSADEILKKNISKKRMNEYLKENDFDDKKNNEANVDIQQYAKKNLKFKESIFIIDDDFKNDENDDDDDDEKEDKEESQNKDDKDNYDFIRQMSMIYDQNKKK
jgi:NIMA (never in mitosis gene a)-related kinase